MSIDGFVETRHGNNTRMSKLAVRHVDWRICETAHASGLGAQQARRADPVRGKRLSEVLKQQYQRFTNSKQRGTVSDVHKQQYQRFSNGKQSAAIPEVHKQQRHGRQRGTEDRGARTARRQPIAASLVLGHVWSCLQSRQAREGQGS